MRAIILAAGVGRRLASLDKISPKCLLRFADRSLLERHLTGLEALDVNHVTIVVGHMATMIEDEVARYPGKIPISLSLNEQYTLGSILSLKIGLDSIDHSDDVIVMDADVLYHADVLARLVNASFANGFLLDERSEAAGEEMMLGVRDGRVWTISRGAAGDWDLLGEGVGFFRLAAGDITYLQQSIQEMLDEGLEKADYEQAINRFLKVRVAHYAPVSDLPWTEIDFDEDVEKALTEVLPVIEKPVESLN